MTKVAIIGAGIGGLTTALALHARGIDVQILEQAPQLQAVGAGIQLSPNANWVLSELGVLDGIVKAGFEPRALDIVDGLSGDRLLSTELNGEVLRRFGQPYLNIHRGDLQVALLDAVNERIPGALQLNSMISSIHPANGHVVLAVENGGEVMADVVVGADGVHSTVRNYVVGYELGAEFTGRVAYRMLVPVAEISTAARPAPTVSLWTGPHAHVVSYWVRGGDLYNIVAAVEDKTWTTDGWSIPADVEALRGAFVGWTPQLHELFSAATDVHKWAVLIRPVPDVWTRGRVALLGDACHAMLPTLAQGGAMAIEDAWVLSASLAARPTDPVAALCDYTATRLARTKKVHAGAVKSGNSYHRSGRVSRLVTHAGLRLLNRRGGMLNRMQWLYGHNVTAS